ncbi:hypothetical protein JCM9803A_02370 [Rhodococcus erythropolis]
MITAQSRWVCREERRSAAPQRELSDFEALKASGALDEVLAKIGASQVQITGEGGFLQEMVKVVLEPFGGELSPPCRYRRYREIEFACNTGVRRAFGAGH